MSDTRVIKFRAWSKNDKIMGTPFNMFEELTQKTNESNYWLKDTVFLQYTGLKDKNGVEIYEGDVLKLHTDGEPVSYFKQTNAVPVVYFNAYFGIENGTDYEPSLLYVWNRQAEVIGNIYETPELLT